MIMTEKILENTQEKIFLLALAICLFVVKIINNYYESLFPWLQRCEKVFGFDLKGYGNIRVYAFLGERYQSFWFNKYTKPLLWPVIFYDAAKSIK